jgi:hypothetical protein
MSGRDPHERGRTATPLELLFDLTFVIAFGTAADELAHLLVAGHMGAGIVGFCFATFAVSWAWRQWRTVIDLAPGEHEIVVRAWDSSAATQPEDEAALWNPKGYVNNARPRIRIHVRPSDD